MRARFVVLSLVIYFLSFSVVFADTCDSNDVARLKEIAKNVTVTYEYDRESSSIGVFGNYLVTVNGLTDELYGNFDMGADQKGVFYTEENQGTDVLSVVNGESVLNIYSVNCEELVRKIKIELPYYNDFSAYPECENISGDDLYVCSEFLDEQISYSVFVNEVKKYNDSIAKKNEKEESFYKYVVILGIIILVIVGVVVIFKKIKDNKLD